MSTPIETPARIEITATCPNCSERAPMLVSIVAALEVTEETSSLKLKTKADKVDHLCGQIELPLKVEGQTEAIPAEEIPAADLEAAADALVDSDAPTPIARPRGARPRR